MTCSRSRSRPKYRELLIQPIQAIDAMNLTDWPILTPLRPCFLKTVSLAFVFGKSGDEALLLTRDDCVYGIGTNRFGCLGLGHEKPRSWQTKVPALSDKGVKDFVFGGHFGFNGSGGLFVIAYLKNGGIYQWGSVPGFVGLLLEPHRVRNLESKITDVACGRSHCLALCDNGEVYSWGTNEKGQLGRDPVIPENTEKCDLFAANLTAYRVKGAIDGKTVVQIACGAQFSLALLDSGKVIAWGCNQYGQLGMNDPITLKTPSEIKLHKGVILRKLACGATHVLALNKENMLYVWGNNRSSQLSRAVSPAVLPAIPVEANSTGFLTHLPEIRVPSKSSFQKCSDIAASYLLEFSVVLDDTGSKAFIWGPMDQMKIIEHKSVAGAFHLCASFMHKPLRPEKVPITLSETVENAFDNPKLSDLTIRVEDEEFKVHKTILMLRSEYFETRLGDRWLDPNEKTLTIEDKSPAVMKAYLKYIYTDQVDADIDLAIELLLLADEYADDDFKIHCVQNVRQRLTVEKVACLYPITRKLSNIDDLNELCLKFASSSTFQLEKITNSPAFENWDLDTTKTFLSQFAKILKTTQK